KPRVINRRNAIARRNARHNFISWNRRVREIESVLRGAATGYRGDTNSIAKRNRCRFILTSNVRGLIKAIYSIGKIRLRASQHRPAKHSSMKLKAVALDVIETLFDIRRLEKKLAAAGLPSGSLKVWFSRVLRDAFALEIACDFKPFAEIAAATLTAFM